MINMREGTIFKDRQDAGRKLASFLEPKYKDKNPLIIGIPRGGVEVAYYVAKQLKAGLSLIISKKIPLPTQKEYGIGAIAEEETVYLSSVAKDFLSQVVINKLVKEQEIEIDRRVEKYRHGKPLPDMEGRTVILVDDGIATGVTLVPVLELCRKKKAAAVIIAAPVSGSSFDKNLRTADEIEVMVQPQSFYAVGQVYDVFGDFLDDDLMRLLAKAEKEKL